MSFVKHSFYTGNLNRKFSLKAFMKKMVRDTSILGHFILCAVFISSCTPGYYIKNHPDLSTAYFEYSIERNDKQIIQNPNDIDLLTKAAKNHVQYAYGFIIEKADRQVFSSYSEAINLYQKAENHFQTAEIYAKTALKVRHPEFEDWFRSNSVNHSLEKIDVPILFWAAAAIGGKISAGRGSPMALIQLPQVKWLLEQAVILDSDWNHGTLHSALFTYYLSVPNQTTETLNKAIGHFEKALVLSNGLDCSLYVNYAENLSVKNQNKSEFVTFLDKALSVNPKQNKNLYLSNVIAQNRAKWLLEQTDELFY